MRRHWYPKEAFKPMRGRYCHLNYVCSSITHRVTYLHIYIGPKGTFTRYFVNDRYREYPLVLTGWKHRAQFASPKQAQEFDHNQGNALWLDPQNSTLTS